MEMDMIMMMMMGLTQLTHGHVYLVMGMISTYDARDKEVER
jgi:hypothetical protein